MKTNEFTFHTDAYLRKHQLLIKDTFDGCLELVTWGHRIPSDKKVKAFLQTISKAEKSDSGKYWAHEFCNSLSEGI